jgi:hypothetical protein
MLYLSSNLNNNYILCTWYSHYNAIIIYCEIDNYCEIDCRLQIASSSTPISPKSYPNSELMYSTVLYSTVLYDILDNIMYTIIRT